MKFLSWNVNGIRAAVKKGFLNFLKTASPDILALQEIKISDEAVLKEKFNFPRYKEYWHSARRPGYSGTAILVKQLGSNLEARLPSKGMGIKKFDDEGRLQTLEFDKFYFLNIYFPNANHELSRLDYKQEFNKEFLKYAKKLEKKKPLIITGDFNVAHKEIDLTNPKENIGNPGFTNEERKWMDKFIKAGFIDTFRHFNGNKIQYSWWSYRFGARARNIGWRIDYFLVSANIINKVKKAFIFDKIIGSDHAPVGIIINF